MKLRIDPLLAIGAAAAQQGATCALLAPAGGAPSGVLLEVLMEGRRVRIDFAPTEATHVGQMLVTCGCLALGGVPPVIDDGPPPPAIISGGRH